MPSKAAVIIESDEKEVVEVTARPTTTIWRSLLAHPGIGPSSVLAQDTTEQMELERLVWRSRRVYSRGSNAARRKCTITDKAYRKRRARNKIAKMSRRANRRRK
jgi:hypothetical protein